MRSTLWFAATFLAVACTESERSTGSDAVARRTAVVVDPSQRFPEPPDPRTLRDPVGDYVQVDNFGAAELSGLGDVLRDVLRDTLDRTHRFSADGTSTVIINKTREVHWRGEWRLRDKSFEISEGGHVGLRGYYYGDEIRVTPGSLDDPDAALIVLKRM